MAKKKATSTKKEEENKEPVEAKKAEETKKEEPKAPEPKEAPKEAPGTPEEEKAHEGPFKLISKEGNETVKAMVVRGHGCIVQVTSGGNMALQWVPTVHLEEDGDTYKIVMGF